MIHKLILKNFKKVKEETFLFNNFDLIVGANNSGKSTALQALAIWQYCVDQFHLSKKKGTNGIQIVLPNFTALPLPEFNLLWNERTDREYKEVKNGKSSKAQIFLYIEIDVYWKDSLNIEKNFCVMIRYASPQSVYAKPNEGWIDFLHLDSTGELPRIVYIPPFSGLEPIEEWKADGNVRQNIGKAQPGSVLRNLLYRVSERVGTNIKTNPDWIEIVSLVKDWFHIELLPPDYDPANSTKIVVEYKQGKKVYDIIAGGSGFHQIVTLLAFLYGYPDATTILFDEPDAHLHVNLQRQIINFLKQKNDKQFLIATHSEEFIKGVEINSILSILSNKPSRVQSTGSVITALSEIDNIDVVRTQESPYILYVEGEDDERILAAWANVLGKTVVYQKFYPFILGGSSKEEMQKKSDIHFKALRQINTEVKRAVILDFDDEKTAINPPANQQTMNEWKRKSIDNYLLVPEAWKRAVAKEMNESIESLFVSPYFGIIDDAFTQQNLFLPSKSEWKTLKAQIFSIVDGKKLLFSNPDSLFHQIKSEGNNGLKINRTSVASAMLPEEIHEDVVRFFENLEKITQ
jgi:hypothetical protein